MAIWEGDAWLGSASGRQKVRVKSNTFHGAKEQIERIYGATSIHNLREVRSSSSSGSGSDFSPGDIFGLVIFLGAIYLFVEYWKFILPIFIILGILAIIGWLAD